MKQSIAKFVRHNSTYCNKSIYSIVNCSEFTNANAALNTSAPDVGIKNRK